MALILSNAPGSVVRIRSNFANVPFAVHFGLQTESVIVTQVSLDHSGRIQVVGSSGDLNTLYAFGEAPGQLQLGGVALLQGCQFGSGFQDLLDYYNTNRFVESGAPVGVQLGPVVYEAFLASMHVDVIRPESPLCQWFMQFLNFPK